MRIVFVDVDGVLNRTGYRPAESLGLRSWIEPELAAQLTHLLVTIEASIVVSSDWRSGRPLPELAEEFRVAGVHGQVIGTTPVLGGPRWREIEAWMTAERADAADVAIIDDGFDMGALQHRFVRISPLTGLDADAVRSVVALFA